MSWNNADEIFPLGYATLPDNSTIINEDLKKSDIKTIYQDITHIAREMITEQKRYYWGDEGEFLIQTTYDVYDQVPHPYEDFHLLNVYGMQMVNDYINLNQIQINSEVS